MLSANKSQSLLIGNDDHFEMLDKFDEEVETHKARAVAIGQSK